MNEETAKAYAEVKRISNLVQTTQPKWSRELMLVCQEIDRLERDLVFTNDARNVLMGELSFIKLRPEHNRPENK